MKDLKDVQSNFYRLLSILLKRGNEICTNGDPVHRVVLSMKWVYHRIDNNFFVIVVLVLSGTIQVYLKIIWPYDLNSHFPHNHTLQPILHHTSRGVSNRSRSRTILRIPLPPGLSRIFLWHRKFRKTVRSTFSPLNHSRCKRQPNFGGRWCSVRVPWRSAWPASGRRTDRRGRDSDVSGCYPVRCFVWFC